MKRLELFFNIVSIPIDIISLIVAALVSFYVRVDIVSLPVRFALDLNNYIHIASETIPFLLLLFAFFGLYNLKGTRKFSTEFSKIVAAVSTALLVVIVWFFFNQGLFFSRFIIIFAWGASILTVAFGRLVLKFIQISLLRRGHGLHKLVIIDGERSETSVIDEYKNNSGLGYKVIAELGQNENLLQQLQDLYEQEKIEEILQANPYISEETNTALVEFARNKGLVFNFVPNFYNVQSRVIQTETVRGMPVISLKNTPLEGWGRIVKRIFDIIASLICLVLTSPLFLIIIIGIKLDSKGKVLYTAPRGGLGKDFKFYKFRTMYEHLSVGEGYGGEEAERIRQELWKQNARGGSEGPFLKIKDDPRVTRFGKFLRKTKLDEIPQFINVLQGHMSMVGPRAHVIDEVERYRSKYRRLFTVKPGIFGLSQIAQIGWPDLPFEEEVRLNLYYIENWSLWLDILVLAKSFWFLFFARRKSDNY